MDATLEIVKSTRVGPPRELPAIDYLRGLAALGVAVFHARIALWVGWREIQAHPESYSGLDRGVAWLSAPAPFLGSLVMLFFVVSGFCVHLPQAGTAGALPLRPYFLRRFLRIYPPYLAAVVVSAGLLATGLSLPGVLPDAGEPFRSSIFMAQNYLAGRQLGTNPALWSLPVELELYLAYPVAWWLARRFGWRALLAGVAAISVSAAAVSAPGGTKLEGNFALYWVIWCGGAWLAERWARGGLARPPLWLAGVGLVGGAAGAYATWRHQDGGAANFAWGGCYFWLVWVLLGRRGEGRLPAWLDRPLRELGRVSYSYYLLHFPLLLLLGALWLKVAGEKPHSFLVPLAACAAIFPPVWLFHRVIEAPSHRLAKGLARQAART